MMQDIPSLLLTMKEKVDGWKSTDDRRHVFLGCYSMMSQAMHEAINKNQFSHAPWVSQLLIRFSEYYFDALEHYEQDPEASPIVWRQVHDASKDPETNVVQNLLLGVNAHINYDLPLALYDCLAENWAHLPETHRQTLKKDHELVNEIIAQTIDSVQDSIVNPSSWSMAALDIIMCRADEWLLSKLISSWRNEVWQVNLQLLSSPDQEYRDRIRKEQEILVTDRGKQFIRYL